MRARFKKIYIADFEFFAPVGERSRPGCLVVRELVSGELLRFTGAELQQLGTPPFSINNDAVFVAFYASAEFSCFLTLGWTMPANVIDLYAEFRWLTSGLAQTKADPGVQQKHSQHSLFAALTHFGLDGVDVIAKDAMRALAMRGGPYTSEEEKSLLDYCQTDVDGTAKLLTAMLPHLDVSRALLRGRYLKAVARMEWTGVPLDTAALRVLRENWAGVTDQLITTVDGDRGIYDGREFRADRWEHFVTRQGIRWPRLESGRLALDQDTFRDMARAHPTMVGPYKELRSSLAQLRLQDLSVGSDGRNRLLLSPFASKTGRNQPSSARFIFGPATWIRSLIKPGTGMALAYVDYEQQEFGIAAALSGDETMKSAYRSGDPYLAFAKQAGAVPADATKATHGAIRDQFKVCALAVQFGSGAAGIACLLAVPQYRGQELLELHKQAYPQFWRWSQAAQDQGVLTGKLTAAFGWQVHVGTDFNPRSLRNFPCQANGAEMLRIACCLVTERGINICAPVHDALLVEAPVDQIEDVVRETQRLMAAASELVLPGFPLRTEAKIVRYPARYSDGRGVAMWQTVWKILGEQGHPLPCSENSGAPVLPLPPHGCGPCPV